MKETKYTQDWKAYDKAKTRESFLFKYILQDLLKHYFLNDNPKGKRISQKQRILMMAIKVYYNVGFRQCKGLIEEFTGRRVSYKTLSNFFNDESLHKVLDDLILITSLPLASMEKTAAIDATGFSTSITETWNKLKWDRFTTKQKNWRKAHAFVGCKSNTIISVDVTEKNVADVSMLEETISNKTKYFELDDFVADKAYTSRKVLEFINDLQMTPLIPFKKNATGHARGSLVWKRMFEYFQNHQEEFNKRYHARSNVETCFSMVKKKFGHNVKTKGFISNVNEIKMKFLCHNICVLIQETYESGLELDLRACVNRIESVQLE